MIELLTKRYNNRKKYDPDALELFSKLLAHADLPIQSVNAGKFKKFVNKKQDGGCACENGSGIMVYSNPDEVATRLHVLMGERAAGNDSPNIQNEISQLVDWLKKNDHISDGDHKSLMHASGLI